MYILKGIGASPGIAIGISHVIHAARSDGELFAGGEPGCEWDRFSTAQQKSIQAMTAYQQQALQHYSDDMAKVYKAYLLMLQDEVYIENIRHHIFSSLSAENAVIRETERLVASLLKAKSAYLQQRAEDVRAVEKMLLGGLANRHATVGCDDNTTKVIMADELTPADTIVYNPEHLQGFITCRGGITSHSVILAKELGIPAVVGVSMDLTHIDHGQRVIVDGDHGVIYVDPDQTCLDRYRERIVHAQRSKEQMKRAVMDASYRASAISVCANVTSVSEAKKAVGQCADGIGLVRTEFLYMNREAFPDEEEQLAFYRALALLMPDKDIVIRTLDIGGDKQADYIGIPAEENPFLGYRAIRYCLENTDIFSCQLRAILRASAYGQLKILLPMITSVEEVLHTKALLATIMQSLREQQLAFNEDIAIGIMIETPAAAILADVLAQHCDFFSIGSNDLTQYITASDRNNSKVQSLCRAYHPAVLRMITQVMAAAKQQGIPVHVCGEMASDEKMIPFLTAAGVDELSVTPLSIPTVKYMVSDRPQIDYDAWLHTLLSTYTMMELDLLLTDMAEKVKTF